MQILYYQSLFKRITIAFELLRDEKLKLHTILRQWKGNFWGSIQVYLTCRYLNINQLKNPFQMNILKCFSPKYFTVSCRPNTVLRQPEVMQILYYQSLFKRITIAFELLRDGKLKLHAIWASMKRKFSAQHLGLPYLQVPKY